MGKQRGKKKQQNEGQSTDGETNGSEEVNDNDGDNDNNLGVHKVNKVDYVSMAQGLKEEGNKFFQKRDYKEAMLKYEKAITMLPKDHVEISHIRANMASCYMQLGPNEYSKAIHECDLALNVTPNYSKALLKRARCYEALNKLDLALRDVCTVLKMDPKNPMALEISEKVKKTLENKGLRVKDTVIELPPDYVEPAGATPALQVVEGKTRLKKKEKSNQVFGKSEDENVEKEKPNYMGEKGKDKVKVMGQKSKKKVKEKMVGQKTEMRKAQDKVVIEEKIQDKNVKEVKKTVKLVYAEDIRWAKLPSSCTLLQLREVIHERFPSLRAVHVKYRDQEGDLVTITTNEELRMAEASERTQDSTRFYVVEVSPEQDPFFGRLVEIKRLKMATNTGKFKATRKDSSKIEDWLFEFAQLFKNQIGVESDACLNLQELGMKVYSEALEEAVTCEEAQELFDRAADKFQEMAARSLLKLGNVHVSGARKKLKLRDIVSGESVLEQIQTAYGQAQKEHRKAREKYEEAARIKPDLFEAFLALGLQQFEEAKLSWYYVLGSHVDLKMWPYAAVLQLYQMAQNNMEKSMEVWAELEAKKVNEVSKVEKINFGSREKILSRSCQDNSADKAAKMKSLLNVLWGAMLYERATMEYKLGLPVWQESLEAAMKKFEVAGTSPVQAASMLKETYAEKNALGDLVFQMEEMVQACNEIHEAKTWRTSIPSSQLEQILKWRISNIFHVSDAVDLCG